MKNYDINNYSNFDDILSDLTADIQKPLIGQKIEHNTFGPGTIVAADCSKKSNEHSMPIEIRATVDFKPQTKLIALTMCIDRQFITYSDDLLAFIGEYAATVSDIDNQFKEAGARARAASRKKK
jgi:hypothetical protein